jgi:hypothetical protein
MRYTGKARNLLYAAVALSAIAAGTVPGVALAARGRALAGPAVRSAKPTAIAAYAWLDGGSTVEPFYAYNPAGQVSANSPASGVYEVDFAGLGGVAGSSVAQVTSYGSGDDCVVDNWRPSSGAGTDLLVDVTCYTEHGVIQTASQDAFDVVVTHAVSPPHGVFDYSWVGRDNSSGPLAGYQYNSSGKRNSVRHLGTGRYQVTFGGPASKGTAGIAKVTAYGLEPGNCDLAGWTGSAKGEVVNVDCYTPNRKAEDRKFVVTYATASSLLGVNGQVAANAFADSSAALYQPKDQYDSTKGARVTVVHYSTGQYEVLAVGSAGNFAEWGGDVQVNAVDSKGRVCIAEDWAQQLTPALYVECYDRQGQFTDSPFAVEWTVP